MIKKLLFFMCSCVCTYRPEVDVLSSSLTPHLHGTHVEVRGLLCGVGSHLYVDSGD